MNPRATLAVIGGSGLYSLFDSSAESLIIDTPYGPTSSPITLGELGGRTVAFLTRHGSGHSVAPHLINYRANIWALKSLGVNAIVSSAAVGGVSPEYPPGALVLTDQFIDRTWGRADTFFDRGSVQHLSAADPFCPELRSHAAQAMTDAGEQFHARGTVVVIQGPRFSTRAESQWFRAGGAHTVNMTLVPEVTLAAELGIGTVNLSFVTDADAGLSAPAEAHLAGEPRVEGTVGAERAASAEPVGSVEPAASTEEAASAEEVGTVEPAASTEEAVSAELVFTRLREAQPRIVAAIEAIIRAIPEDYAPRELIAADAVAAVMAYPVTPATAVDAP